MATKWIGSGEDRHPAFFCDRCDRLSLRPHKQNPYGEDLCQRCRGSLSGKHSRQKIYDRIFAALGDRCACCGETERLFLNFDHIHDDGNTRRASKGGTYKELRSFLEDGCPPGILQVLCSNCNNGKRRNGGICPHYALEGYPVAGAQFPVIQEAIREAFEAADDQRRNP